MNKVSRTITGVLTIALGLFLTAIALLRDMWLLFYGIPIIIIGLFIFFNKKEDEIEKIKK